MAVHVDNLVVAILAGGAGTRFWPASTRARPKQFLALTGERTLLQLSYDRARAIVDDAHIFVITAAPFVDLVRAQLPSLAADNVVGEPERKDTAAAIVFATLLAEHRVPGGTVAFFTSDHVIDPVDAFARCISEAVTVARAGDKLVTLGIAPTYPATAYGYLEVNSSGDVVRFVEKPKVERARVYVSGGQHLWNSGMFVWRAQAALTQMRTHLPVHVRAMEGAVAADGTSAFPAALARAFRDVTKISIDYGLMEPASAAGAPIACVASTFSWSDVGSFPALAEHLPVDDGNAHRGRVRAHDARDNLVWCEDGDELVALVGVSDLVVVRVGKRTLVTTKDRA
ncbi:MAG TPA: mannose-1-phosphate guanylyltransferase, partial [Myxococcota bacterium]